MSLNLGGLEGVTTPNLKANNNSNIVETDGFTLFFPETSYGTDLAKIVTDFGRVRRHAGHHLSELPKWKNVILSLRGHLDARNYTYPNSKPSFGISARPGAFSVRVNKVLTIFSI